MITTWSPTRVLLVDDIEENLIALEALVRRVGVEVSTARSARDALELCLVNDYALALLDVNMPDMDGVQLAELMRGSTRTKNIPIIFVTAAYEPQRVFQGYDAGAVDFLFKPVDPRILHHKIATFVALYEQKQQLAGQLDQMERLHAQLSESMRMHETFVASLNHDLRAPLHTISVGLSMLENLPGAEEREVVRRVEAAADRMNSMIDQLYDLARTRIGSGLALDLAPADLQEVMTGVVQEADLRRGTQKLELAVAGETRGTWDVSRLSRMAANLISNGLTHGDKNGTITVAVDGGLPDTVTLSVTNPGTIPSELLPQIFEPFRRGKRSKHGLGLGLYIVNQIASAHGGTVNVTSEAGITRFLVTLPRLTEPTAAT